MMLSEDWKPKTIWFLAGLAAGAAVSLLLAPYSGRETRRRIKEKGVEGAEQVIGKENIEKGREVYARGKEAGGVARDAADLIRRGARLSQPLESTDKATPD